MTTTFRAAVAHLNAVHAAFLAHGLARTSKASRKAFMENVAHANTMSGQEGGLSLAENTADVLRYAAAISEATKVSHRVEYVAPAPVQPAPEAEDDTHASADAASVELVAAGFTASPVWGAMWDHADGRRAMVARNDKGRFFVRQIPAPGPVETAEDAFVHGRGTVEWYEDARWPYTARVTVATDMRIIIVTGMDGRTCYTRRAWTEEAARRFYREHAKPAPVAMVAQPVQQQQGRARNPVTRQIHAEARASIKAKTRALGQWIAHCEGAGLTFTRNVTADSEEKARRMVESSHLCTVTRMTLVRAPAMVPQQVQQQQGRDTRHNFAPVLDDGACEAVDGLTALMARIESVTGPRVVSTVSRAAPDTAADVVQFDGPGAALAIAATVGLLSTVAAYGLASLITL